MSLTKTSIANMALAKLGDITISDISAPTDKEGRAASLHYDPCLRELLRAHFWGFATVFKTLSFIPSGMHVSGALLTSGGTSPVTFGFPFLPDAHLMNGRPSYIGWEGIYSWSLYWFDTYWRLLVFDTTAAFGSPAIAEWRRTVDVLTPDYAAPVDWVPVSPATGVPVVDSFDGTAGEWKSVFHLPDDFIKLRRVFDPSTGRQVDRFDLGRVMESRCLLSAQHDSLTLEYVAFVDDPAQYDPLFVAALVTLLASRMARAVTGSDNMEGELRQLYETVDLPNARVADGHDTQSNENHPLMEMLTGSLTGQRGNFFPDRDEI